MLLHLARLHLNLLVAMAEALGLEGMTGAAVDRQAPHRMGHHCNTRKRAAACPCRAQTHLN